jgi:hypothetical protein
LGRLEAKQAALRLEISRLEGDLAADAAAAAATAAAAAATAAAARRRRFLRVLKPVLGVRLLLEPYHPPRPLRTPARYTRSRALANSPTISVVTPSFGQARFLPHTVGSVLDQGYSRLQYVVQDGGSRDGSLEILEHFRPRLHHAESVPDRGQAHAINLGFAHTDGDIMAYLNSDDLLLPGSLQYVARYFARHPEVDVVYGHRVLINEAGEEIGRWILPPHRDRHLLYADYVPQETLFWRRRIWERAGAAIDESFHYAIDWDLLLRFLDAGARIVRLPRFLGAFRVHVQQKTSALAGLGAQEMDRLRARCHGRGLSHEEVRGGLIDFMLLHSACRRLYQLGLVRY